MRTHLPASRGSFKVQFSLFDFVWAVLSPLAALYFRDAAILSLEGVLAPTLYFALSVFFSLVAFSAFRIRDGMTCYFSVHDAVDVMKAVFVAALLTYIALFTVTRLEGIPRSVPFIHALILAAGLITARSGARLFEAQYDGAGWQKSTSVEPIIMIGSNRLSSLYMKFLEAYSPNLHRVMAVLDARPQMIDRAIEGIRVVGPPQHLEPIINEFAAHGIRISRVIAGGEPHLLSGAELAEVRRVCDSYAVMLDFVPQLLGLTPGQASENEASGEPHRVFEPPLGARSYFSFKALLDFAAALALALFLSPIWLLVGAAALIDVGSPVLFWQQRVGQGGRTFLLQKIRTLQPPFDRRGRPVADAQRISPIGRFLRNTRLDEMPQLLNVLVGDMSLIGPRPLLPQDQPPNSAVRLTVRPGITGWAQVNGGNLLAPLEKYALDEWYIRNASVRLDLQIIVMTLQFMVRGERRSEQAIAAARALQAGRPECRIGADEALRTALTSLPS
jgi:lipopolysaccharide/colanic/teichoic acid biosynthesis glycosyltransferase